MPDQPLFTARLYKKGEGILPFQRRWGLVSLSLYPTTLVLADEKWGSKPTHTLPLANLLVLVHPKSDKHLHMFELRSGSQHFLRLKALSSQQLLEFLQRVGRLIDTGTFPNLRVDIVGEGGGVTSAKAPSSAAAAAVVSVAPRSSSTSAVLNVGASITPAAPRRMPSPYTPPGLPPSPDTSTTTTLARALPFTPPFLYPGGSSGGGGGGGGGGRTPSRPPLAMLGASLAASLNAAAAPSISAAAARPPATPPAPTHVLASPHTPLMPPPPTPHTPPLTSSSNFGSSNHTPLATSLFLSPDVDLRSPIPLLPTSGGSTGSLAPYDRDLSSPRGGVLVDLNDFIDEPPLPVVALDFQQHQFHNVAPPTPSHPLVIEMASPDWEKGGGSEWLSPTAPPPKNTTATTTALLHRAPSTPHQYHPTSTLPSAINTPTSVSGSFHVSKQRAAFSPHGVSQLQRQDFPGYESSPQTQVVISLDDFERLWDDGKVHAQHLQQQQQRVAHPQKQWIPASIARLKPLLIQQQPQEGGVRGATVARGRGVKQLPPPPLPAPHAPSPKGLHTNPSVQRLVEEHALLMKRVGVWVSGLAGQAGGGGGGGGAGGGRSLSRGAAPPPPPPQPFRAVLVGGGMGNQLPLPGLRDRRTRSLGPARAMLEGKVARYFN